MELNRLICEYAIEYMGNLYFSVYRGNSFYSYNRQSNESYKMGPLIKHPKSDCIMSRIYKMIYPVDGKIFLFPWTGESYIGVYNLDNEELSYIDISMYDSGQYDETEYKICDCFAYNDQIYAVGLNYPAVLRIDIKSNKVKCVIDFRNDKNLGKWHLYLGYGDICGSVAYIPMVEESAFIKMNLDTGDINKISIGGEYLGFTNIILDSDGNLYLLERWTNRVIHAAPSGEEISVYEVPGCPDKKIDRASYFDCLIREGNGFYLFPVKANHIYYYDFDTKEFEICSEFEDIMNREYNNNPNKNGRIFGFSHKEHYAMVVEGTSKMWHEINLSNRSIDSFEVKTAKNAVVKMWNYCKESDKKTLNGFMDYIDFLDRYNLDPKNYR